MNRRPTTGVWLNEAVMDALAASFPDSAVSRDESLEREFEQRLADCPKLAYRVALGVLHNTAEAEDVAQEAMLRAYRNFHRLRDRERFRGWLVRAAFRLSLGRIRSRSRRERHERAAFEEQREASVENLVASREFERQVARAPLTRTTEDIKWTYEWIDRRYTSPHTRMETLLERNGLPEKRRLAMRRQCDSIVVMWECLYAKGNQPMQPSRRILSLVTY